MNIPKLELEDFLIVPEKAIDVQIWINEHIEELKETQPFYYRYLLQISKTYGPRALTTSFFTFHAINHALERDSYGG